MRKNVQVVGWYHRKNLGDDVFEYVFKKFFENEYPTCNYNIKNINEIEKISNDTDVVLFGGGDLINDYFMKKFWTITDNAKQYPVYAVSIGIPYPKLIDEGYLDSFDYIIHRNQTDNGELVEKYGDQRVKHFPDLAMLLPKYSDKNATNYFDHLDIDRKTKKIGICLSKTIYSSKEPEIYDQLVENLAVFFMKVAQFQRKKWSSCLQSSAPKYELFFIPFCVDSKKDQDDREINKDIYEKIGEFGKFDNIHIINNGLEMDEIIPIFNFFDLTVCTRFHANIFSVITNTPMLPIYSSRKVDNLIEELNLDDYAYKMKVNPEFLYPIEINSEELMEKFLYLEKNYDTVKTDLQIFNEINKPKLDQLLTTLKNLIFYSPRYYSNKPLVEGENSELDDLTYSKCSKIIENINKMFDLDITDTIVKEQGALKNIFDESQITLVCQIIAFTLLKDKRNDCIYGLKEQILGNDFNLFDACKWILNYNQENNIDFNKYVTNTIALDDRKLDMEFIKQHGLRGYHRSGWNYVLNHLENLHTNQNGIIFDSYLDKTFGWDHDFLESIGFIPYTREWVGVLHHTPEENYSENNLTQLFNKRSFIESLDSCKALIVFSEYLRDWIRSRLPINIFETDKRHIKIIVLKHPTQMVSECLKFNWRNFLSNKNKKVVHIGAWLRNSYSIYDLDVPAQYQKCALKGKAMDNYFITDKQMNCIETKLLEIGGVKCTHYGSGFVEENTEICRPNHKNGNKYVIGLIQMIKEKHESVRVLDCLSNEKYDSLLSENIVFIELIDASAVNTILECIVRNTPILVNRLPATEEYLGCNYPLFYDNVDHAYELLRDDRNIHRAHKYLAGLDKEKFTIEYFINQIIKHI